MPYFLHFLWKQDTKHLTVDALWEHYTKCLKAHDWSYALSHDDGVKQAGQEQRAYLLEMKATLDREDKEESTRLYKRYSFFHDDNLMAEFDGDD